MVSNIKKLHSVLEQFKKNFFCYKNKRSKFEVEKVAIWHTLFNICVLSFTNKKLHYNRAGL